MSVEVGRAAGRLAAQLGGRLPQTWREAYHAVPRHLFVPAQARRTAGVVGTHAIDWSTDPVEWMETVYSEDAIVACVDQDGRAVSYCSPPGMVFAMLTLADVQPGQRVLEVGTGTGWSSALMAWRLGACAVTTVEIDADVAHQARRNHHRAGVAPTVVDGDGTHGWADNAPYDRVISTCFVHTVPYAWVEQTQPGGVILSPVSTPFGAGGLLGLCVASDGSAAGRFVHTVSSEVLRGQQFSPPEAPDNFAGLANVTEPKVRPSHLLANDAAFAVGFLVPHCKVRYDYDPAGRVETAWLLGQDSWAAVNESSIVYQYGARRLWDEAETAYGWWREVGSPAFTRFGMTVTRNRQTLWLDDPHRIVTTVETRPNTVE